MKLLTKLVLAATVTGAGATMYAAPGGWLSPNGAGSVGAGASLSLADMVSRTATLKEQMVVDFKHVQHLQQVARNEKDVIKLNCVNDKLIEIKPQMNIADHSMTDLQSAQDAQDQRAAFDQVTLAGDQVRSLREAAEQCIGQRVLANESANDYTHPYIPDYPDDNPFGPTIEPPAYASPVN